MTSERGDTIARDLMMHRRGSLGLAIDSPVPRPSEAFHLFKASSSWSVESSQILFIGNLSDDGADASEALFHNAMYRTSPT